MACYFIWSASQASIGGWGKTLRFLIEASIKTAFKRQMYEIFQKQKTICPTF